MMPSAAWTISASRSRASGFSILAITWAVEPWDASSDFNSRTSSGLRTKLRPTKSASFFGCPGGVLPVALAQGRGAELDPRQIHPLPAADQARLDHRALGIAGTDLLDHEAHRAVGQHHPVADRQLVTSGSYVVVSSWGDFGGPLRMKRSRWPALH